MYYVIIDNLTRVILKSSDNTKEVLPASQSYVEVLIKFDPSVDPTVKWWKLDDKNVPIPAKQADVDLLNTDNLRLIDSMAADLRGETLRKTYLETIDILANDGTLPSNLKNYFVALQDYAKNS